MSDLTPPPAEEPQPVPTPEQPVVYTPAPAVAAPVTPSNGMGIASLIFGIVQFFCIPFIGGILAIVFGRIGINKAKRGEATNGGVAKAGFWLGIVGLVLSVIGGIIAIIVIIVAVNLVNTNTDPQINHETGLANGQYQMNTDANFSLNGRCGFTGDAYDASGTVVKEGVTVSGEGVQQCSTDPTDVSQVRFDVVNGVAEILAVQ